MRAHAGHLKYMLIAATVILIALATSGLSLTRALPYALLLACPLSMVMMMAWMSRAGHGKDASCHDPAHHHDLGTPEAPRRQVQDRVQDDALAVPAQHGPSPRLP